MKGRYTDDSGNADPAVNKCKPRWRKPTIANRCLTADEALIADTIRMGLRYQGARAADFRDAEVDYANQRQTWWPFEGERQYEENMSRYLAEARAFRQHGAPRSWPKKLPPRFWYWLALRQNWDPNAPETLD